MTFFIKNAASLFRVSVIYGYNNHEGNDLNSKQMWYRFSQYASNFVVQLSCLASGSEVIRGYGYSSSCGWWSLGVIMFKCLFGSAF